MMASQKFQSEQAASQEALSAVLVLNCGSSSVKFSVCTPNSKKELLCGVAEKLGTEEAFLTVKKEGHKQRKELGFADHAEALKQIITVLADESLKDHLIAVGHRVVHGGETFSRSTLITAAVKKGIADCASLAPLHNPANLEGIEAAEKAFPSLAQVAVFDTAFHSSLREEAYLYPLPFDLYKKYGLRRYGFHGTSFRYVSQRAQTHLGEGKRFVIAHLGNGCSLAALKNGHCLDTTMGLTPLDGLVHGTRCGSIDPSIPQFLTEALGQGIDEVTDIFWKKSGLLGLSGLSNDCRDLEEAAQKDHKGAQRALAVFDHVLAKNIAALCASIGGIDALIFTGGIGENSDLRRAAVLNKLSFLGFDLDEAKNAVTIRGVEGPITTEDSKPAWVIPTNEELMIAQDAQSLVEEA